MAMIDFTGLRDINVTSFQHIYLLFFVSSLFLQTFYKNDILLFLDSNHTQRSVCVFFFFNVRCFVVVVFKYFIFFPDVHFKLIVSKLFYFWALFVLLFYFKVYFFPFLLCFSNWIVNVPCGCVIVFINI